MIFLSLILADITCNNDPLAGIAIEDNILVVWMLKVVHIKLTLGSSSRHWLFHLITILADITGCNEP